MIHDSYLLNKYGFFLTKVELNFLPYICSHDSNRNYKMDLEKLKQYEEDFIKHIKNLNIMKWSYVSWDKAPFSRGTAYAYGLNKLDTIKEAFEDNRSNAVDSLIQKWINSDNATLQIAAMRILCDTETHQKLNQSYIDHTNKGDKFDSNVNVENEWMKLLKEKKEELGKPIE